MAELALAVVGAERLHVAVEQEPGPVPEERGGEGMEGACSAGGTHWRQAAIILAALLTWGDRYVASIFWTDPTAPSIAQPALMPTLISMSYSTASSTATT